MLDPEASPKELEEPESSAPKRKRATTRAQPVLKRPARALRKRPASMRSMPERPDDEHEDEKKTPVLKRPGSKSNTTKNQDETEPADDMLTHIKDKEDEEIDSAWQELSSRQKIFVEQV